MQTLEASQKTVCANLHKQKRVNTYMGFPSACQREKRPLTEEELSPPTTHFFFSTIQGSIKLTLICLTLAIPRVLEFPHAAYILSANPGNSLPGASRQLFRRYHLIEGSIFISTSSITEHSQAGITIICSHVVNGDLVKQNNFLQIIPLLELRFEHRFISGIGVPNTVYV